MTRPMPYWKASGTPCRADTVLTCPFGDQEYQSFVRCLNGGECGKRGKPDKEPRRRQMPSPFRQTHLAERGVSISAYWKKSYDLRNTPLRQIEKWRRGAWDANVWLFLRWIVDP